MTFYGTESTPHTLMRVDLSSAVQGTFPATCADGGLMPAAFDAVRRRVGRARRHTCK